MQICTKCKLSKPLDSYGITKLKPLDSTNYNSPKAAHRTRCKECEAERARQFRKKFKNYRGSGKIRNIPKEHRLIMSIIRARVKDANARSKKAQLPFNITPEYIYDLWKTQKNTCAYTGEEFQIKPKSPAALSLDKIIPEVGYVNNNIQLVCWAVNRAKGDLSHEVFLNMCKVIHERATTIP